MLNQLQFNTMIALERRESQRALPIFFPVVVVVAYVIFSWTRD